MPGILTMLKFNPPNSDFQTTLERRTQSPDNPSSVSNWGLLTLDSALHHDLYGFLSCWMTYRLFLQLFWTHICVNYDYYLTIQYDSKRA